MIRSLKVLVAMAIAMTALFAVAIPASAHTGAISNTQSCEYGIRVTAHLDDNVAASATWELHIDGALVRSGVGPGPMTIGPVNAHTTQAGFASLTITYGDEMNIYQTGWDKLRGCTPPKHYDTRAAIPGPCGDPYVRFVVKNRGNVSDKVVLRYEGRQGVVKQVVTIPAQTVYRTGWRYALPDTTVTVKSLTQHKVLAQRSFEAGNYGRCYAVNKGFTPIR